MTPRTVSDYRKRTDHRSIMNIALGEHDKEHEDRREQHAADDHDQRGRKVDIKIPVEYGDSLSRVGIPRRRTANGKDTKTQQPQNQR